MPRRLSEKSIEALRILSRHRDRPLSAKPNCEATITYVTAWTLEEHGLVQVGWRNGCERVWIRPAAKQLLETNL